LLSSFGYDPGMIAGDRFPVERLVSLRPRVLILDYAYLGTQTNLPAILRPQGVRPFCYHLLLYPETAEFDVAAAVESGFDDFIRRPVSNAEVLSRLRVAARAVEYEKRIETVERRDVMSQFLSRRALLDALRRHDEGERHDTRRGSLIAVECDFIAPLQEAFGATAAERQCQRLADVIRQCCEAEFVPARVDAERFAVFLPGHEEANSRSWCAKLCAAFVERAATEADAGQGMTLSCATAGMANQDQPEAALERALAALQLAHDNGGNCTVVAGEFDAEREDWLQSFSRGNPFAGSVARDLMTPFTLCLAASDTIAEAAARFRRTRLEILPVYDVDGSFLGIVREEDCLEPAGEPMETAANVSTLVTRDAVSIEADEDVAKVMEHFFGLSDEPLLVQCGGEPSGTISHRSFAALVRPVTLNTFALRDDSMSPVTRLTVPDTLESQDTASADLAHDSAINRFSMRIQTLGLAGGTGSRP
jgi:GGDEF domain-containing protein